MRTKNRPTGFTLLEVLMVIVVIALLIALVWPVLAASRTAGRRTTCIANMRQLHMAYSMYFQDYGVYPLPAQLRTGSYLKDQRVWLCPDDTSVAMMGAAASYTFHVEIPPNFTWINQVVDVSPDIVLLHCDHHLGRTRIKLPNDGSAAVPPTYPFHLVLRTHGAVERIHVSRIREVSLPGTRPVFAPIYPGEPGYASAKPGSER